jgi:hypothetical protein
MDPVFTEDLGQAMEDDLNLPNPLQAHGPDLALLQQMQHIVLQQQHQINQFIHIMQAQQQAVPNPVPVPAPPTTPASSSQIRPPKIPPPDLFDGTMSKTDQFIRQLTLYMSVCGQEFSTVTQMVSFALTRLTGDYAGVWADLVAKSRLDGGKPYQSFDEFIKDVKETFGDPDVASTARHKLRRLKQGKNTAEEYGREFKAIAAKTGYDDVAKIERYCEGLHKELVDVIYKLPEMPKTLEDWMKWAEKFDRQWRQREQDRSRHWEQSNPRPAAPIQPKPFSAGAALPGVTPGMGAPMDIGRSQRKGINTKNDVCYKCHQKGHFARNCPARYDVRTMTIEEIMAAYQPGTQPPEQASEAKEDFQEDPQ